MSVWRCYELKNQGKYPIVLNILILNKNLNSAIRAAVYDIFYRADNNMRAQKVIDFVTLTWISRRTYKERLILRHFYIHLYKIKYMYYNDFWKCLNWRLAPKLYRQLLEFNFGRLAYDLWMCYCFGNLCCHNNYYSYSSALLSKR